jgi:hypothetical protein
VNAAMIGAVLAIATPVAVGRAIVRVLLPRTGREASSRLAARLLNLSLALLVGTGACSVTFFAWLVLRGTTRGYTGFDLALLIAAVALLVILRRPSPRASASLAPASLSFASSSPASSSLASSSLASSSLASSSLASSSPASSSPASSSLASSSLASSSLASSSLASSSLASSSLARPPAPLARAKSRRAPRFAIALLLLSIAGAAGGYVGHAAANPHGQFDAWAIWNLRARFLFRDDGAYWRRGYDPLIAWSHADYPPNVSANVARGWTLVGAETRAVPWALHAAILAALGAATWSTLRLLRGPTVAAVATAALLALPGLPELAASQQADLPFATLMLASLACVALADADAALADAGADAGADEDPDVFAPSGARARARALALAGLLAGFAAWTKNEGILFLVAVVVARTVAVFTTPRRAGAGAGAGAGAARTVARDFLPFALGLLPLVIALVAFKLALAPPNDVVHAGAGATALAKLMRPARYVAVLGAVARFGWVYLAAGAALVAVTLTVGPRPRPRPRHPRAARTIAGVVAVMLTGYFVIYLTTPYDPRLHVKQSVDRLLTGLWPVLVLGGALVVKDR